MPPEAEFTIIPARVTTGNINVPHAIFSRHGGISPQPWNSLNLSYGVEDSPDNVQENRRLIKLTVGAELLLSARQVHGAKIFCAKDLNCDLEVEGYDALITDQPGVGLLIQQADCQAILLHDPVKQVIAAIHCGWRGNVADIIGACIARMREHYQTDPALLRAVISPSLGPCCAEFRNFRDEFPKELHRFRVRENYFDLRQASRQQLLQAGVIEVNIEMVNICTMCSSDYFSYRRSIKQGGNPTGRQGSVIMLPE